MKILSMAVGMTVGSLAVMQTSAAEPMSSPAVATGGCSSWLNHSVGKLHRQDSWDLCQLTSNQTVLLVNTASFCGYTPQFEGLEALYQRYKDKGLVIIGFPSDDFFQESDESAETAEVCYVNYGVTFPMTAEINVRGGDAHPVFEHLKQAGSPLWNFNKYLIGKDGSIIGHFGSNTEPLDDELLAAIETAL